MAAGILEVDIIARTKNLEQGLKRAESQMKRTGDTVESALGGKGAKAALMMGKVFAVMGAIEGAAKGISAATEVTRGIFAGLTGDSEEFRRSMEKAGELLKGLPFGIGPVVQGIEDLIKAVGGFNKSMEESAAKLAEWNTILSANDIADNIRNQNKLLKDQRDLAAETDELKRAELKLELDLAAIQREKVRQGQEIMNNSEMDDASKRNILKALREEFALKKEMAEIAGQQAIQAEQERRMEAVANGIMDVFMESAKKQEEARKRLAQERKEAEKQLREQRKEELKQLGDANKLEEERLGKVNKRLGMMGGGGAGSKSGFTQTASTAMGSFTFAESGAQDVMASLAKEAKDIQGRIDGTAKRIEEILKQLAQRVGFV